MQLNVTNITSNINSDSVNSTNSGSSFSSSNNSSGMDPSSNNLSLKSKLYNFKDLPKPRNAASKGMILVDYNLLLF